MKATVWLLATAVLLCSCATPFIERAHDSAGVSGGLGAGTNAGVDLDRIISDNPPAGAWNLNGTAFVRWRTSHRSSMSVQAGFTTTLPHNEPGYGEWVRERVIIDARFGYKHDIGRTSALKYEVGVGYAVAHSFWPYPMPIVSVAYLHDFGRHFTGRAVLGTDLIALDGSFRFPVARSVQGYLALGVRNQPVTGAYFVSTGHPLGFTLGLGLAAEGPEA